MPDGDPLDFSDRYNTRLDPETEKSFQQWAADQSKAVGRSVMGDTYDYDLRGWFQANGPAPLSGGHLTDQWKKPNHPTFSDQSRYHGVDGMVGGSWGRAADGADTFTPGKTNMYAPEQLTDYFATVEPNAQLLTGFAASGAP